MDDYLLITGLNDFIFCPYSIYLHNVYMEGDESLYQAIPQVRGKQAHDAIDAKKRGKRGELISLSVYSEEYLLMGKIDLYRVQEHLLIERKYRLNKKIYQGQIYQLWAQYLCLKEMGYDVESLAMYEISTNRMVEIPLPSMSQLEEFKSFIHRVRTYNPSEKITVNSNKCTHCIYNSLCDQAEVENVY